MNISSLITKYDPDNQYDVLLNYYTQIQSAWSNEYNITDDLKGFKPREIIISGMGGSAISANLLRNYAANDLMIPLFISRNYHLPLFAGPETLLIISSYSGNTEETLSSLNEGLQKGCKIACITTGGKIGAIAAEKSLTRINLKPGYQPRFSIGQSFFTLLKLLQTIGLIPAQDQIVERLTKMWRLKSEEYGSDNVELISQALKILGRAAVIYSGADSTDSVGMRLKGQLNENSKKMAFHLEYPEMNHNEIISWENVDSPGSFVVLNIKDSAYHSQIKKRFEITTGLIEGKGVEVITIESDEVTLKERLLDLILKVDWLTYYAAVLGKKDPSEIDYIHFLKKNLE